MTTDEPDSPDIREQFLLEILAAPGFFEAHDWEMYALREVAELVLDTLIPDPDAYERREALGMIFYDYEQIAVLAPKQQRFEYAKSMILRARLINPTYYQEHDCCFSEAYQLMHLLAEVVPRLLADGKLDELRGILEIIDRWLEHLHASDNLHDQTTREFQVWNYLAAGFAEHIHIPTPELATQLLALCGSYADALIRPWMPAERP